MFCTKCGEKVKDDDDFCAKCGKKVERDAISEQANEGDVGGKPKSRALVLKITLGVVAVALLVGGWFGWSAYSSFRDKREKRRTRHEERVHEEELQRQYEQAKHIYECILRGEGSFERMNEAVRLATPAAENGTTDAQVLLGACYEEMYGLERESEWIENSAKWYLKAAKSGHQYAQGRIANYYLEGIGVPEDPDEAYKWAHKAGVLLKDPNIQLEPGRNGLVLSEEELPPSRLTIEVDRHGMSKIDGRNVTAEQIQQNVKKRLLRYHEFPCMIMADKRVELRHVWKVMTAYQAGLIEAKKIDTDELRKPSEEHDIEEIKFPFEMDVINVSLVALYEKSRFGEIYSKLNVFVPTPTESSEEVKEENDMSIKILIGENEEYVVVDGCPTRFDKLDEHIKELARNSNEMQILLGCTEDSRHGTLIRVLDICHKHKMYNLHFYYGGLPFDDVAPPTSEPVSMKPASVDAMLNIKSTMKLKSVAGTARSAGMRGDFLKGGEAYGDATTERAVMMALRWLKATQEPDGTWGAKPELGLTKGMDKAAGAGFAVLTFLAHGETPSSKEFGPTVERALNYLVDSVYVVKDKSGNEAKDPNGNTPYVRMSGASGSEYGFLIGTYALCEAYAMTGNPNVKAATEKALRRIIDGQTPMGGWNYNMKRVSSDGAPDDISYGGWALQALKAAKMAGIHLEGMDECIKKAVTCLKTRNYSEKAGFVYRATTNHKRGGGCLAGVGCLAMQLLGYANAKEVANALNVMKDWEPSLDKEYSYVKSGIRHNPQYYCYYATQCKYQAGMAERANPADTAAWKKWNQEMKDIYPKAIVKVLKKDGTPYTVKDTKGKDREIGHWVNGDHYNYDVMGTCLAALQLMVYYRYLPTTQTKAAKVEAEVQKKLDDAKKKDADFNVSIDI